MSMKDFDVTVSEYFNWCSEIDWAYIARERDSLNNSEVNLGHRIEYFKDEKYLRDIFNKFDIAHYWKTPKPELKEFIKEGRNGKRF